MLQFGAKFAQRLAQCRGRFDGNELPAVVNEPRSKIRCASRAQAFDIVIDVAAAGVAAQVQDGRVDANRLCHGDRGSPAQR